MNGKTDLRLIAKTFLIATFFSLFFSLSSFIVSTAAQELPDEIRGYKVHKAKITVINKSEEINEKDGSEAFVRVGEPQLVGTSLSGIKFAVPAEIISLEHGGKIDFLTFQDFKVNGIAVDVEEFRESFEFKKNQTLSLPKPIEVFIGARQVLQGAIGEIKDRKEEWDVTGRVFIFGKFKKWGFNFKRVVPVNINIKIKNPIRKEGILPDIIP
jgi:hypothetical protein